MTELEKMLKTAGIPCIRDGIRAVYLGDDLMVGVYVLGGKMYSTDDGRRLDTYVDAFNYLKKIYEEMINVR